MIAATLLTVAAVLTVAGLATGNAPPIVNGPLPVLSVAGTYYEIGFAVGQRFASMIRSRWAIDPGYAALYEWAASNATAEAYNASWYASTQRQYPHLLDELRGVSDGSGVDFGRIWFMTTHHEASAVLQAFQEAAGATPIPPPDTTSNIGASSRPSSTARVGHCTDVRSDVGPSPLWGHNEDSGAADVNHTYLVSAVIVDAADRTRVLENFTAFSYAGTVAGIAYGWNHHGLIVTLNALFAKLSNLDVQLNTTDALPRGIINRALYAEVSVEAATRTVIRAQSVVSFSVNLGTVAVPSRPGSGGDEGGFANIEVDPMGGFAITRSRHRPATDSPFFHSTRDHLYHANEFLWLTTPQFNDTSSAWRVKRLNEYPAPTTVVQVRAMLGDTHYADWPIYRNGGGHGMATLSTAVFDASRVAIYTANPATSDPVAVFPVGIAPPSTFDH